MWPPRRLHRRQRASLSPPPASTRLRPAIPTAKVRNDLMGASSREQGGRYTGPTVAGAADVVKWTPVTGLVQRPSRHLSTSQI